MLIPHGALIAVLDGASLEMHRNSGDQTRLQLDPVPTPKLDVHSKESGHRHRSSSANPDRHLLEEDAFIAAAAAWLNRQAIEDHISALVVVAAPRALGELRHHYHRAVQEKLVAEVDRDLVGRPAEELQAALLHVHAKT
jgi:protein required for attachment to host cells